MFSWRCAEKSPVFTAVTEEVAESTHYRRNKRVRKADVVRCATNAFLVVSYLPFHIGGRILK